MNLEKQVEEFKNGNQDAFNVIYQETFSLVRFVIYSYVPNAIIIEDLIQDTYMKVNEKIKEYHSHNFKNWIYTIAKNTALDYLKKKKEDRIADITRISDKETHPYLNYVLNHLEDKEREIFLMKVLCGHTTKRISQIVDMSPSEVNQLYYQAKDKLKKSLKEDSYEFKKV